MLSYEESVRVWQVLKGRLQDDATVTCECLAVDPGRLLTALLKVRIDRDPRITDISGRCVETDNGTVLGSLDPDHLEAWDLCIRGRSPSCDDDAVLGGPVVREHDFDVGDAVAGQLVPYSRQQIGDRVTDLGLITDNSLQGCKPQGWGARQA